MLRQNLSRLVIRLIILTTVAGALLLMPVEPARNTVSAGSSCPICDDPYSECLATCPPLGQPGHFACISDCNEAYRECKFREQCP